MAGSGGRGTKWPLVSVLSFLELLLELFLRGLLEFVLPLLLSGMLLVLQPLRCCFCGLREPYFLSFGFSPA